MYIYVYIYIPSKRKTFSRHSADILKGSWTRYFEKDNFKTYTKCCFKILHRGKCFEDILQKIFSETPIKDIRWISSKGLR